MTEFCDMEKVLILSLIKSGRYVANIIIIVVVMQLFKKKKLLIDSKSEIHSILSCCSLSSYIGTFPANMASNYIGNHKTTVVKQEYG